MDQEIPFVDVVGLGLNASDTLILLPHFPAFRSKVEFTCAELCPGGQVASAMVACQSWGLRTRYIGTVGDDPAAELQRQELARAGVETHLLSVPNCPSQSAFILVDQSCGERTILWKRDPRLRILPEQVHSAWILRARALHVDGHDTGAAAAAAGRARRARIPVTADVDNLYPGVEALLENVDYLLASEEFPSRLTGQPDLLEALPSIQRRFGCRVAGATLGADGALAWDGAEFHYTAAYRVRAVDTTGAGDIFHGAFLYALLQGWPLGRQLDFSCAAAALNCTALGCRGGIRTLSDIEGLMRESKRCRPRYDTEELRRRAGVELGAARTPPPPRPPGASQ